MGAYREDSLDGLFVQVARLHFDRARTQFRRLGLGRGQPPVLFSLWHQDGRSQRELSEELGVKPATITVTLQRMEKAGFIERRSDPDDLRLSRVFLTDQGTSIRADVERALQQLEDQFFAGFTPAEKLLLRRFFLQMKENLGQEMGSNIANT